jgi:DNA-binding transcriptional regulator YiaG
MSKLDTNTQKEYSAMISNKTDLMDLDIIEKYTEVSEAELEKMASDLGLTVEQLAEKMEVSKDELDEKLEQQAIEAKKLFDETERQIKDLTGKEIPKAFKKASTGDLKSYANLLG